MRNQRTFRRRLTGAVALFGVLAVGAGVPARADAAERPIKLEKSGIADVADEPAVAEAGSADAAGRSAGAVGGSADAGAKAAMLRIMPLGDSITWGVGSNNHDGYRTTLHRRLATAGLDVDFVGSGGNGRGADRDHEGHKGWTIAQLAARVEEWLAAYEPDVILLHIGTNDIVRGVRDPGPRMARLLDRIAAARPDAQVFVAKIVGMADYDGIGPYQERIATFNRAVERLVAERGKRFHLVDQSAIHGIDMRNWVHPNDFGYAQMAWNWYRALEPVLNADGATWPRDHDPTRAAVAYRCVDHSTLDPAVSGCHLWYRRKPAGAITTRVWQLPVRTRVKERVEVDGTVEYRWRVVTRWVSAS